MNNVTLADKAKTQVQVQNFKGMTVIQIRDFLKKWTYQLAYLIPGNAITVDRLLSLAAQVIWNNQDLATQAPAWSWISALMECAQTGLDPSPALNYCYFLPRREKGVTCAKFQISYKGIAKLIRQTKNVKRFESRAIYSKDVFKYEYGTNQFLQLIPSEDEDRGELVKAYALIEYNNGGLEFVVMNKKEIMAHKDKSPGATSKYSPWNPSGEMGAFEYTMWQKTVSKELSKLAELTTEASVAIQNDSMPVRTPDEIIQVETVNNQQQAQEMKRNWPELVEAYFSADLPKECYEQITKAGFNLQTQAPVLKNIFLEKELVLRPILEKYL